MRVWLSPQGDTATLPSLTLCPENEVFGYRRKATLPDFHLCPKSRKEYKERTQTVVSAVALPDLPPKSSLTFI
jgi:hypothetical protein